MADPFTLGTIAANCVWGLIGNRFDASAVGTMQRLKAVLTGPVTPGNHDILKATHTAYVRSIQLMAETCERNGADPRDHFAARALTSLAHSPEFTTFRADGSGLPLVDLENRIRAIYDDVGTTSGEMAAQAVVAEVEAAMREPLTDRLRQLFLHGADGVDNWARAYELFFSEEVKENSRVFRILTIERLNEITGYAERHEAALDTFNRSTVSLAENQAALLSLAERQVRLMESQRRLEEGLLIECAHNIEEILDFLGVYDDPDGYVDHLRKDLTAGHIRDFVNRFYDWAGPHQPGELTDFIRYLWRAASPDKPEAWEWSDGNRIAIAISTCICKNLRLFWKYANVEGAIDRDAICLLAKYIRPSLVTILEIGRYYSVFKQDDSAIRRQLLRFDHCIDGLLVYRDDIVDEHPDAPGFWKYLEALRSCQTLDDLWQAGARHSLSLNGN